MEANEILNNYPFDQSDPGEKYYDFSTVIKAMQEFASQQTAQKDAEIDKWRQDAAEQFRQLQLEKEKCQRYVDEYHSLSNKHSEALKEVQKLKAAHQYTLTMTRSFPEDHVISDLRRNATEALNQYQNK